MVRSSGMAPGRLALILEVLHEVLRGELVEPDVLTQALQGIVPSRGGDFSREGAQRPAELERAAGLVAFPERRLAGLAGGRRDHDAIAGDVLDPPGARAEHEDLAPPALVHHLLVQLPDPAPVREEHAEQPAVGDRAAVRDRDAARASRARTVSVVRSHTRRGRSSAKSSLGYRPERRSSTAANTSSREVGEVRRLTDGRRELVDGPLVDRAHRDQLLGEHVERVPWVMRLLDQALAHPLRDDRGLEQVPAELREDLAPAGLTDLVTGTSDPLQTARDRARRLHLDHQVDGAHVDPELERRRGHDGAQPAFLERVFHLGPLLARERAVVRAYQILVGELVQPCGQPLGHAAGVHEDDRRAVRTDQVEQLGMDAGQMRGGGGGERPAVEGPSSRGGGPADSATPRSSAMSSTGTITSISMGLPMPRVDDRHRTRTRLRSARRGSARSPRAGAGWPTARSVAAGSR